MSSILDVLNNVSHLFYILSSSTDLGIQEIVQLSNAADMPDNTSLTMHPYIISAAVTSPSVPLMSTHTSSRVLQSQPSTSTDKMGVHLSHVASTSVQEASDSTETSDQQNITSSLSSQSPMVASSVPLAVDASCASSSALIPPASLPAVALSLPDTNAHCNENPNTSIASSIGRAADNLEVVATLLPTTRVVSAAAAGSILPTLSLTDCTVGLVRGLESDMTTATVLPVIMAPSLLAKSSQNTNEAGIASGVLEVVPNSCCPGGDGGSAESHHPNSAEGYPQPIDNVTNTVTHPSAAKHTATKAGLGSAAQPVKVVPTLLLPTTSNLQASVNVDLSNKLLNSNLNTICCIQPFNNVGMTCSEASRGTFIHCIPINQNPISTDPSPTRVSSPLVTSVQQH